MQVEKVNDTLYKLTGSLYLQTGSFTVNLAACVGKDGILLIDTGWTESAERLNEAVRELGDGAVKLIIITHPHRDHYGGCGIFKEEATLIAHKNGTDELSGKYFALDKLPGQELPIISLEGELALRFNGEDIKIIPRPGHTNADMVVYFVNSGVALLGDLVFSDIYPGIFSSRGGSVEQYIESIEKLINQFPADVKLIAGHGRDYTLDDLKAHYQMALGTTELIRKGITDGKNAQDMIEEDLLKDWAKWSSPIISSEAWITQAYESLSGQVRKSIAEALTYTIMESGIEAAIQQYHELKQQQPDAYSFAENELNMLGYQLLWRDMGEEAIQIHKLNIQAYPESANPYDSLGEAYMVCGDKELAIANYEKVLELNPDTPSAIEALKRLKGS